MTGSNYGLLSVLNNRQIDERREQQAGEAMKDTDPHAGLVDRLSGYLSTLWQSARDAASEQQEEMLEDLRQREGKYSPAKLAEIRAIGGSEIFMMLTNVKCRTVEGWILDVMFPAGDRPFSVEPTPVVDIPGDLKDRLVQMVVMEAEQAIASGMMITEKEVYERSRQIGEQVKERMKDQAEQASILMEDAIDDLYVEGCWYDAMEEMVKDMVSLPFGVLKGPVIRNKPTLSWQKDPQTGRFVAQASNELTPIWYSPSPLDIFPSADSKGPADGYLFERIKIRRGALHAMIGVPGYNEDKIRAVLRDYRKGFSLAIPIEQQRQELENTPLYEMSPEKTLDVLEFHGSVPGSMLIEWGMDAERVEDPEAEYEVTAWKIGRYIVRCVLNEDPMKRRPYEICHFDKIKGQFHGRGVPRIIRDLQAMCNAAARALSNNMGLSSGPLVEIEADRLAKGTDLTNIFPWKQFQTQSSATTPAPAVRFHNIPSNAKELIEVHRYFSNLADQYSGVQGYDQGVNQKTGAAGTASGLAMLMNASGRQIKAVVGGIDRVIDGSTQRAHTHIMLYGDDESVKTGDIKIQARGTSALVAKEQMQMRRAEFMAATANQFDMEIIGMEGRAEMLREAAKGFDWNPERIVPGRDEIMAKVRAAMLQAIPQNPQGPAGQGGKPEEQDVAGNPAGGLNLMQPA